MRVGSCVEKESEAGFSHFLEHLVFRSTEKYPDNKLTGRAMYLGSNINAYTEFDSTCFYITLSSRYMKDGMEILSQLCRYANFSKTDFDYEKSVVLEEIAYYENDPEDSFLEKIPALYLKKSTFKRPIIGTRDSLSKASYYKLTDFYKRHYRPDNCFLVVSGDVIKSDVEKIAEQFFGDWQMQGQKPERDMQEIEYADNVVLKFVERDVSKSMIAFSLPEISNTDVRSHTLDLISRIFSNGKKSRLYRRLFIEQKLIDQIKSESFSGISDGVSVIAVNPKNEKQIAEIVTIFLEEFYRLADIEKNEIEDVKTEMNHSQRYALEFAKGVGFSLGVEEVLGDYRNFSAYLDIIDRISDTDVRQMVERTYKIDKLGIFIQTSQEKRKKLEPVISKIVEEKKNSLTAVNQDVKNSLQTDYDFRKLNLDCGGKLLLKRVTGKPTIGITAVFKVSQLDEQTEIRGINYLTSVLLLYGNEKRSYKQLLDFCSRLGIQISISAVEEVTYIKIKCFPESLYTSLELLADILLTSLIPYEHFLNIQQTILSNIERMKDYPSQYATYLWKKQVFGKESNLLDREGTKTTLRKLTRKRVFNWYSTHYCLDGMSVAVVGDFSFLKVTDFCNRLFKVRTEPAPLRLLSAARSCSKQRCLSQSSPTERRTFPTLNSGFSGQLSGRKYKKDVIASNNGAVVHVGGLCCPASRISENTAFNVLSQIMGGDINSRLYDELREKRGLAYNVGFGLNAMQHIGFYAATAIVDKKSAREVIYLIKKCFQDLIDKGVTEEELNTAKNSIRGQILRSEESVSGRASTIAILDALGYDYEFYLKREERLEQVTGEQIVQVAGKYLAGDDIYVHLLV